MMLSNLYWFQVIKSYKKHDVSLTMQFCKDDIFFKVVFANLKTYIGFQPILKVV